MQVLALDTTTRAGSVALVIDEEVVLERSGDPARTHAERLPGELMSLLGDAGATLSSIDVFAIASGPGSFTGLRIGIATVQGLAFVNGRRIVPVSALEALAHLGSRESPSGTSVAAWMDAHRRDVFSALYRVTDRPPYAEGRLREIDAPSVGDPSSTISRWMERGEAPRVYVGDGAVLYADVIAEHQPQGRVVPPSALAGTIGRIAVHRARAGDTVDPAGVQPLYVRRPDAEIAKESSSLPENSPPQRTQGTRR